LKVSLKDHSTAPAMVINMSGNGNINILKHKCDRAKIKFMPEGVNHAASPALITIGQGLSKTFILKM